MTPPAHAQRIVDAAERLATHITFGRLFKTYLAEQIKHLPPGEDLRLEEMVVAVQALRQAVAATPQVLSEVAKDGKADLFLADAERLQDAIALPDGACGVHAWAFITDHFDVAGKDAAAAAELCARWLDGTLPQYTPE